MHSPAIFLQHAYVIGPVLLLLTGVAVKCLLSGAPRLVLEDTFVAPELALMGIGIAIANVIALGDPVDASQAVTALVVLVNQLFVLGIVTLLHRAFDATAPIRRRLRLLALGGLANGLALGAMSISLYLSQPSIVAVQ